MALVLLAIHPPSPGGAPLVHERTVGYRANRSVQGGQETADRKARHAPRHRRVDQEASRGGAVGPEEVVRASLPRLDAELELANSAQARLALREEQVEVARKLEEFVIRRLEVKTVTELEVLHARALRLKVEVALEREKNQVE